MKVEMLEEFVALSKTLNYRLAAEELFITQPTLSKHMMELERELGVKLLDRDSKHVALTEVGLVVAQKSAYLTEVYRDLVASARLGREGRIVIASPLRYTMFSELVARVREAFARENPKAECWIKDFSLESSPAELLAGDCDIVLNVFLPEYETASVRVAKLCQAPLRVWASGDGALSGRTEIAISELEGMIFRPASDREDYPWAAFVGRSLKRSGVSFTRGAALDDQYQLGPLDYGLVFGGVPTAMLGFNARQIDLTPALLVTVAAYYRADGDSLLQRDLISLLQEIAPRVFAWPHE